MAHNDFGYTPWGRDWVRLAAPLIQTRPDPRLPRARRLVLAGRVRATVDGSAVRAAVSHGRTDAVVRLDVAPMSSTTVAAVTDLLRDAHGIVTDGLHLELVRSAHPPAPTVVGTDCSCTDETGQCVHLLALYYEVARRVDDDPRVALEIQGFGRTEPSRPDSASELPQRWLPLTSLNPAEFFEVP